MPYSLTRAALPLLLLLSPSTPFPAALLFQRHLLLAANATCYDGSPGIFYHRNCTANHDRKPGDPTDFCAGEQTWVRLPAAALAQANGVPLTGAARRPETQP